MADQNVDMEKILRNLHSLEVRLSRLENVLNLSDSDPLYRSYEQSENLNPILGQAILNDEEKGIELQIGRFGLAWLGNIVLLFGITFLTQFLINIGYRFFPFFIGYLAAVSIFLIAKYLRKTNVHLAFIFRINAQVLLFYITVRLHFFSLFPLIQGKTISIILLLLLVVVQVYLSVRNESQVDATLAVFFAIAASILADTAHVTLPIITLTAASAVYLYQRFKWKPLVIVTIFITYISFSLWLSGNSFMGHRLELVTEHHYCIYSGKMILFLMTFM
jgi:hypothetical protein